MIVYRIYEVARPGDFVEGEIRLIVDLQGGMIASDFVTLFIEGELSTIFFAHSLAHSLTCLLTCLLIQIFTMG